jgi:serine/threonine-protein kinase
MDHARPARKLEMTPEARRERRRAIWRGSAGTLATLAVVLAAVTAGTILLLGQGPAEVTVPNVVGQSQDQAVALLKSAGLEGQDMAEIYSDEPPNQVIKQRPEAQMAVKQGRMVELTLSKGPKTVKVPSLVGKSVTEAQDWIQKSYLKVGTIHHQASEEPEDTVLSQTPEAGTMADRDSEVALAVSGGADYGTWQSPSGAHWVFRSLSLVVPAGEDSQRVRVVLQNDTEDTVYDELHRPGDKVSLDVHGKRGTQVKVYLDEKRVYEEELR